MMVINCVMTSNREAPAMAYISNCRSGQKRGISPIREPASGFSERERDSQMERVTWRLNLWWARTLFEISVSRATMQYT